MIDIKDKNIIITGISGFIGSYVAVEFLKAGARVYGLVRPGSLHKAEDRISDILGSSAPGSGVSELSTPGSCGEAATAPTTEELLQRLHYMTGDLEHIRSAEGLPRHADAFLHFAWDGVNRRDIDDDAIHERSRRTSLDCIRLASELGARVFMDAGSRVEYGIKEDGIMEESMDCDPVNAYGRNKLLFGQEAENLCRELSMRYIHLRFFSVYGRGDHPWSIISTLTRELPAGHSVSLSACRHRWNFMEVRDAARAVLLLYKHADEQSGEDSIVNVASKDTRVLKGFVEEIYELSGRRGELCYGSFQQAKEGALSICPVTDRLFAMTGGEFKEDIPFSRGAAELIAAAEAERQDT